MQKTIEFHLPTGTDVRPVAMLVQIASQYESKVYLECGDKNINAKSIMGVMSMALNNGAAITVTTTGPDEEEALNRVADYLSGAGNEYGH